MCLAIPGKLVKILTDEASGQLLGQVDYGGVLKNINLSFTPEAVVSDYLIVHAGFAITILDEEEAQATLLLFNEQEDNRL